MTTPPSAQDIKTLTARGWLLSEIAERFGITKAEVVAILDYQAPKQQETRVWRNPQDDDTKPRPPKHAWMIDRSKQLRDTLPFTAGEIAYIRKAFSKGVSAQDIAAEFGSGVNATTVRFVATTASVYQESEKSA